MLNMECMGCGLQRSVVFLFKGHFLEAFKMYPAIYTLIPLFLIIGVSFFYKFKKVNKIINILSILSISIIIISFIIKQLIL